MSKKEPLIEADLSKAEILVKVAKGAKQLRRKKCGNYYANSMTLYNDFGIYWDNDKGDYDDSESVIKRRTLDRRYKSLIDDGYLVEKDNLC